MFHVRVRIGKKRHTDMNSRTFRTFRTSRTSQTFRTLDDFLKNMNCYTVYPLLYDELWCIKPIIHQSHCCLVQKLYLYFEHWETISLCLTITNFLLLHIFKLYIGTFYILRQYLTVFGTEGDKTRTEGGEFVPVYYLSFWVVLCSNKQT